MLPALPRRAGALLLAATLACRPAAPPPAPGAAGLLPAAHGPAAPWPAGRWAWTWRSGDAGQGRQGDAELLVTAREWRWSFPGQAPSPAAAVVLEPCDGAAWEPFRVPPDADGEAWLPVPRLPAASADYASVCDLLASLTAPRFASRVTHWPARPIPVRIGAAAAGRLDLAACLRAALARWNEGEDQPWFVEADTAAWGVRLLHLPGRILAPPLAAQITRLDDEGRPLRIHLLAGDNYDDARDSVYAVRGFVHELGHALFLWGHSTDRAHVLWGAAPPLAGAPSPDERKAALLWHGLPEGLDLSRYGAAIPP